MPVFDKDWQAEHNMKVKLDPSDVLTVTVDCKKDIGRSSTGKTILIAKSGKAPSIELSDGTKIFLNFNAYKYPPKEKS